MNGIGTNRPKTGWLVWQEENKSIIRPDPKPGDLNPGRYGSKHFIISDFMKVFPLGYWLVWDRPESIAVPLCRIPSTALIDEEKEIEISLKRVPPVDWPEQPRGDDMLLIHDPITILCKKVAQGGHRNSGNSGENSGEFRGHNTKFFLMASPFI